MALSDRAAVLSASLGPQGVLQELPEFWMGFDQQIEGDIPVPGTVEASAFVDGTELRVRGEIRVRHLIQQGSSDEDEGNRPLNHFHDPTKDWGSAGFYDFGGLAAGISSVWWQQIGGEADQWPKARETYLAALLEPDFDERMRLFAKTFRSLGHIIHLVQDVATPAHSRNDNHYFVDRFHDWAAEDPVLKAIPDMNGLPFQFTGDLVAATTDTIAARPVARIIDATELDRGQPAFADNSVGLAEYSNSQFLSDDRTWPAYPYPRRAAMTLVTDSYAGAPSGSPSSSRKYFQFAAGVGEGETDYYVAAELPLARSKTTPDKITALDRRVLEDYGRKLLPRAIGYSVSAIDHFFRGRIEITGPDRFIWSRAEYEEGNTGSFGTLRFKVRNGSESGQETSGSGKIRAVVHYRTSVDNLAASDNLFDNPSTALTDSMYAVSEEQTIELSRAFQELRFDFPDGIPTNSADVWLVVVYQGDLGGEEEAVLVGGRDLPEPTPIDYANLTDYDCVNGQFHYVANLDPDDPARDLGAGSRLIGPYLERHQYRKGASAPTFPSSTNFDFFVEESRVSGAETIEEGLTPTTRVVVLTGGGDMWFTQLTEEIRSERDVLLAQNSRYSSHSLFYWPNRNDLIRNDDGTTDRFYLAVDTYRGVTGHHMTICRRGTVRTSRRTASSRCETSRQI